MKEQSYTIVEYIVKQYGLDKLNVLLRSPHDIKGALNVTEDELWKGWVDFLKKNYK